MLNWIVCNRTFLTFKLCTYTQLICLKLLSKWLNSALNDPKRVDTHKTKQPTNQIISKDWHQEEHSAHKNSWHIDKTYQTWLDAI